MSIDHYVLRSKIKVIAVVTSPEASLAAQRLLGSDITREIIIGIHLDPSSKMIIYDSFTIDWM